MKKVYTKNIHGITVKKCCASCSYKDLSKAKHVRFCTQHEKEVKACGLCSLWEMSKQVQLAGWSQGRVKRKEYLEYLLTECEDRKTATQLGLHVVVKSIEELRVEFEQEQGSIYINL